MPSLSSFKKRKVQAAALFLLAVVACVHFRLYAYNEYPKRMARQVSSLFIYSNIKKVVDRNSAQKFASYPKERQKRLHDLLLTQTFKNENLKIKLMIEDSSKKLLPRFQKSMQYLGEVDPYYYLSLTKRVLADGRFADRKDGRNYFNPMMLAPLGAWYPIDVHPYVGAYFHRLLQSLRPALSLMQTLSLLPIVLSCLCLVPLFLILFQRLRLGLAACLAGSAFFVSCPMFVRRSLYGWFDTDPYNVLFPLILLYLFMGVLTLNKHSKRTFLLYGLGIGMVFALYSLFWRGWMLILAASMLAAALAAFFIPRDQKKGFIKILALSVLSLSLFLTFFWGTTGFMQTLADARVFAADFLTPKFSVWPDVFISVGELRPVSFLKLSALVAYPVLILLAFPGLIKSLWASDNDAACFPKAGGAFLLTLLFFHLFLAMRVERFALFLVMPLSLGLAISFHELFSSLKKFMAMIPAENTLKKLFSGVFVAVTLYVFIRSVFVFSHESIRVEHPIYNESWDKMMSVIKNDTPEDSIVTSWWSPGHFITGMGERRVTFDGATQNTPQAYWVARFFLETSENKALGILRMLRCSGNQALDYLSSQKIILSDAISILDSIFALKRDDAKQILTKSLTSDQAEKLLDFTHPKEDATANYIFLYDDMIRQVMALEFIGNWDFKKAERFRSNLQENPGKIPAKMLRRGQPENTRLLWSLSDGPWPEEPEALVMQESADSWSFINGVRLKKDFSVAVLESGKFGRGIPKYLYVLNDDGTLKEISQSRGNLNLGVLFFKDKLMSAKEKKNVYKTVVADKRLMDSLAFRLFYMSGSGLRHFKPVAAEDNDLSKNRFYLYRVN